MEGAGMAAGPVKAADILEVAAVIVTGPVIDQIRRELRRRTGHNMDPAELSELITSSVLRPDALGRPAPPPSSAGYRWDGWRTWPDEVTGPGSGRSARTPSSRHFSDMCGILAVIPFKLRNESAGRR
jgi:hypothetical protein